MSRKVVTRALCLSLLISAGTSVPPLFGADVETVGDLKVQGVIESTGGGFKFPDGSTLTTAGLDGLLFNVGLVVDNSNSNTGNLLSGAIKFGTGATGEGIASQRTTGVGQNGIDFYTNSTSRLFIKNNGYVGIGTRDPLAKLHVLSSDITQAAFGAHPIYLQNADGSATSLIGLNLHWDGSKYVYGSSHAGSVIYNGTMGLMFGVAAPGTVGGSPPGNYPKFLMRMTSDGKVRIGDNNAPAEALDVLGNIKSSGFLNSTSGAVVGSFIVDQGNTNNGAVNASALTFGLSSGEGIASKRTEGGNRYGLDFYSNFLKRMSITQGGNVGIGTDTPAARLDVQGDAKVSGTVAAGPGQTGTPLAYGGFAANGTKNSGSANLGNCTWNAASTRYECPLTGYHHLTHVTVVTAVNTVGQPIFATSSSGPADVLYVRLFNPTSATPSVPVQGEFHVVVFKP